MKYSVVVCLLLAAVVERAHSFGIGSTLYCWRCISTHPGCGHDFAWLWHWSQACPEPDDTCVKLIERKGAAEVITRDCLSSFKALRTDLPADHYEGCKHSSVDLRLAHYVNNSIKELDVKMNYYDSTEWCLCRFDNRCNGAFAVVPSAVVITLSIVLTWFYLL